MNRCSWVNLKNPVYIKYHDEEWGNPQHNDKKLLELLILECFQAGLSWECVLNKRENFKKAYDNFDIEKIVKYDEKKEQELLLNPLIIRNKLKIRASIINSIIFKKIQQEYGTFDNYIWKFTNKKVVMEDYTVRTYSPLSDEISKDLKKRGMKFIGTTTVYAYLQSIGVINAHGKECDFYKSN